MNPVAALASKDLKLLFRDKLGFFFTLVYPLVVAIIFGSMFGGKGDSEARAIPLAVVDEDSTAESSAFLDSLAKTAQLKITLTSRDEALQLVRRGRVVAFVVVKKGFGNASKNPFWGDPPAVEIGADPSRKAEAAMIEGVLISKAASRISDFFDDPALQQVEISRAREAVNSTGAIQPDLKESLLGLFNEVEKIAEIQREISSGAWEFPKRSAFTPLKVSKVEITDERKYPTSAYAVTFPQAATWALIGVAAGFGIMLVIERKEGTLMRLLASPLRPGEILLGKALACFIAMVGATTFLFVVGYLGFSVIPNSVPLLAAAIVTSAFCFVGLMMLLSALPRSHQSIGGMTWGIMLVLAVFGGSMVPLIAMPAWMRTVGSVSPMKWAVLSMEGAVWRQFSAREMLEPCGILILMGIIFAVAGTRIRKLQ